MSAERITPGDMHLHRLGSQAVWTLHGSAPKRVWRKAASTMGLDKRQARRLVRRAASRGLIR